MDWYNSSRDLVKSIENNDFRLAEYYLQEKNADPNKILPDGLSAIHYAVGTDAAFSFEFVKLLFQYGANPNLQNSEGLTPVHTAVSWGKHEALVLLLSCGGDPTLADEDGCNAIDMALESRDQNCIDILKDYQQQFESSAREEEDEICPQVSFYPLCSTRLSDASVSFSFSPDLSRQPDPDRGLESPGSSPFSSGISAGYPSPPGSEGTGGSTGSSSARSPPDIGFDVTSPDHPRYYQKKRPDHDKTIVLPEDFDGWRYLERQEPGCNQGGDQGCVSRGSGGGSGVSGGSRSGGSSPACYQSCSSSYHSHYQLANDTLPLDVVQERLGALQLAGQGRSSPDACVETQRASGRCEPDSDPAADPSRAGGQGSPLSALVGDRVTDSQQETLAGSSGRLAFKFSHNSAAGNSNSSNNRGGQAAQDSSHGRPASSSSGSHLGSDLSRSSLGSLGSGDEYYMYSDPEAKATLIERRLQSASDGGAAATSPPAPAASDSALLDDTVAYDWRAYQTDTDPDSSLESGGGNGDDHPPADLPVPAELEGLSNGELRLKLVSCGERPGPVTDTTRGVYLSRLARIVRNPQATRPAADQQLPVSPAQVYSPELSACLHRDQGLPDMCAEVGKIMEQFERADPTRKWREGTLKSSFTYLLLDPRVTKNLPGRSSSMSQEDCFKVFVPAIFYVGKGKRARPYAHFYEALDYLQKKDKQPSEKVKHILDIWHQGQGVVSLHCFQNVIPVEAYTREALMVDAIGLSRLSNIKKGDYYGIAATWTTQKKRKTGVFLLKKAMDILLCEGERQIRPADLKIGQ